MKKWTINEKEHLRKLWEIDNKNDKEIALILNRTRSSVRSMAHMLKLVKKDGPLWEDYEIEILKELYPTNVSREEIISRLNNKKWSQIKTKACDNLKLNRPIYKEYNVIHNYFSEITTIKQAYILGFIAADGYISSKTNSYELQIGVHKKDKKLLNWIISEICPDYKIKYNKNMNLFSISNKQIKFDLYKYGITPQKTFKIQWPSILTKNLEMPFILGYFDGDGCLSYKKYKPKKETSKKFSWLWNICSASPNFLETIKEKIYNHTEIEMYGVYKSKNCNAYNLALQNDKVIDIDKYISRYNIGLKRKRIQYYWDYNDMPESLI